MARNSRRNRTVAGFTPNTQRAEEHPPDVVIRPLPKAVFLYPTLVASIAMGVLMNLWPQHDVTGALVFLTIVFMNLGVLALDFPTRAFIGVFLGAAAAVLGVLLIDLHVVKILPWAISLGRNLAPTANDHFYFALASALGVIFSIVFFVVTRLDYWTISGNTATHHRRFSGTTDHSLDGMKMDKDVMDVFEYLLLASGRLVIRLPDGPDLILDNVPRVHRVHARIATATEALNVNPIDPYKHPHAQR